MLKRAPQKLQNVTKNVAEMSRRELIIQLLKLVGGVIVIAELAILILK